MTVYTMFHSGLIQSFEDDTADDSRFTKEYSNFIQQLKLNILDFRADYVILDTNQVRSFELFPGYLVTDWWVIYAKVLGAARFTVNYEDPLVPAAKITSNCTAVGNTNFPGLYTQSVQGLTPYLAEPAIKITGLADSTKIQIFYGRSAADNNANWIANK